MSSKEPFCNNCGKHGHLFHICKIPITSIGIIAFRYNNNNTIEYLMIRRKDTLGYIDFLRGKFSVYEKQYIMNMLTQMTSFEKNILLKKYEQVKTTGNTTNLKDKIIQLIQGIDNNGDHYDLKTMIESSYLVSNWQEPEWGFPKGRRNSQENDFNCAVREFCEETGYSETVLKNVRNFVPIEEIFTGSNYNSYRHKYYLMFISYRDSIQNKNFQKTEVSDMEWKSLTDCLDCIRPYNLEKKNIIENVDKCLQSTSLFSLPKNNVSI